MRILLTGGTGFIGSHFLKLALNEGHEVFALRRPASKPRIALPREPHWIEEDLASFDPASLKAQSPGVEKITLVHLASHGVSPQPCTWKDAFQFNLTDSLHLLLASTESGISRIIACGSCVEYGKSAERYDAVPPDAPLEPVGPYAASKAAFSLAASAICREKNLELAILRAFAVFGEGQHPSNFWPSLQRAALAGEDFPMTPGEQIRDFTPVDEAARALLQVCTRGNLPKGIPLIENIGSGRPQTLSHFAEFWWRFWKAKGTLLPGLIPYRSDEVMRYVPALPTSL